MKKFFIKFLPIILLSLIFPVVSFAEISKIVFVTNPQTIEPGKISKAIKVQFQNSSGEPQPVGETLTMIFQSSSDSATKEFVNESGNPVSTSVYSSYTSRTFYYRDSKEGTFTITIGIEGKEWTASQQITVSSGSSQQINSNSSGEVLETSTDSSYSDSSSFGGSTTEKVSSLNAQLDILAGSDRTTSPGSPIWFQAALKKNSTSIGPELNWSFGDGNVGVGPLVSHSYKYPGDYVVVLSARAGDIFSVSRLKVKVTDPDIKVSDGGEYLEILNNSNAEINLFNWKIENDGKGFIFQPNTIILPKYSIKIDKSLLKMKGLDNSQGISLKDCTGKEIFAIAPVKEIDLSEVSKNLEYAKKEFFAIQDKAKNLGLTSQNNNPNNSNIQAATVFAAVPSNKDEEKSVATEVATDTTENIIYEAPKQEGFVSKLTNFIKRVFSR
jgi:hypothetical protein